MRTAPLADPRPDDHADNNYVLSMIYSGMGDKERAREHFERAEEKWRELRDYVEKSVKVNWSTFPIRGEAAALLGVQEPVNYLDRFFLARGYWEKGDKEQALKLYHDAVRWMDQHAPKNDRRLYRYRVETEILLGLRPAPEFVEPAVWPPTKGKP